MTFNYKKHLHHLWLPYSNGVDEPILQPIKRARGVHLTNYKNEKIIDGISSWWCVSHGHNHPHIVKAIKSQLKDFSHIMFGNLAHKPAYLLAEKLIGLIGSGITRVFYSDSGSVAVEVALKMAVQYYTNQGFVDKTKFIHFENGYHGETLGAMSVSQGFGNFQTSLGKFVPQNFCLKIPNSDKDFAQFEEFLHKNHRQIAGLIIEPLVQGAGGFKFHTKETLEKIFSIAKKYDILFILDEIMVGFLKLGKSLFAFQQTNIQPDIICLSKGLTGGALPLAITAVREEIYKQFSSKNSSNGGEKTFNHGGTFMANPLACSAAIASLELFAGEKRKSQVTKIEEQLKLSLKPHAKIKEIRIQGAIGVLELKTSNPKIIHKLREKFLYEQLVLIRPFANVIYLMPPFIIREGELEKLIKAIYKVLDEI